MEVEEDGIPGEVHKSFEKMENVYDKLYLLNYEEEFVKKTRIQHIHRLYFISPTNPGEQFYNFVSHAAWLIKKCGKNIDMPEESDDPNRLISSIQEHIKALGGDVDFVPSKVKSGCGPEIVNILEFLTDKAISVSKIQYEQPVFKQDEEADEENGEEEQEVNLDRIEEDMDNFYSSEEDENDGWIQAPPEISAPKIEQKMLPPDTDAEQWRLEVERVLPQLKITVKQDGQDWRWRQEQMKTFVNGITHVLEEMNGPLERMSSEATALTERVSTREKFLNEKFEAQLTELRGIQKELQDAKEKQKELSNVVGARNKELAQLNEQVEATRRQLEDRGSLMADGAPVVAAKKAINNLKRELGEMEIEIGVMEHSILRSLLQEQSILRDKSQNL